MIVNTPQQTLRAALGQFFVKETSTENLAAARSFIERSETAGADLLVLPECIIARKLGMPDWGQKHAEPLDGPFVSGLREATRGRRVTVVCTVQAKIANESRYANDLLEQALAALHDSGLQDVRALSALAHLVVSRSH